MCTTQIHIYFCFKCSDNSVNITILKPRLAAAAGRQYVYVGFSRRKIPRSSAYTISDKAIRFRGIRIKVNQFVHVPTSVDMQHFIHIHARVLSNLANRQTDRQTKLTRANTFISSFVGGNDKDRGIISYHIISYHLDLLRRHSSNIQQRRTIQ